MRIQYEISDDLWKRMARYAPNPKTRHTVAQDALKEWVTRHEGRDQRLRQERLIEDIDLLRPIIQKMIDDGIVIIK